MSYASNADIEERLGSVSYVQLTDDTGSGSADEDKVTEARLGAEGEVDSYLGRRYAVPIDVTSHAELASLLRSITLDLAEHRLRSRRPPVPEDVRRRRESAVQWLQRAASGEVVLPASSEVAGNPATGVSGEVTGSPRVMSREELEDL
jgi:phage gp36-like protein